MSDRPESLKPKLFMGSKKDIFLWLFAGLALLAMLYFLFPLLALGWRALELYSSQGVISQQQLLTSLWLSLLTTAVSVVVIFVVGTPLAYAFSFYRFPLKSVISVVIELPVVMPPVVAGLALLAAFGRRGVLGAAFEVVGVSIPFTTAAVIMAQVFIAAPFYIRTVQNRFSNLPAELEEAAQIDGASPAQAFFGIILPLSGRAMLSGLLLSWARALGEFGATILFAGNLQGTTRTMPLLVYSALERDFGATYFTASILLVMAAVVFVVVRRLAHLDETR